MNKLYAVIYSQKIIMRFREIEVIDNKLKRLYYEMKKFFRKIPAENLSGKIYVLKSLWKNL